jgi:protein scribble
MFLYFQGILTEEGSEEKALSPAEQRALKAEMRAAWRQARLKSLEQVNTIGIKIEVQ